MGNPKDVSWLWGPGWGEAGAPCAARELWTEGAAGGPERGLPPELQEGPGPGGGSLGTPLSTAVWKAGHMPNERTDVAKDGPGREMLKVLSGFFWPLCAKRQGMREGL